MLRELDGRELSGLRAVGAQWQGSVQHRASWQRALPVDPKLSYESEPGGRRGRFVEIRIGRSEDSGDLEAMPLAGETQSGSGRLGFVVRRVLMGPVLRSAAVAEERMRKLVALPGLSSDALSSVAYGPEAMLAVLVLAGSAELKLSLPVPGAIIVLMIAVGLGYRQVIRAYPQGGGSYRVASENLGSLAGLLAGAGLILDYILTVTVSIAAGVAAVTSAVPSLASATVPIGLAVIAILVAGNLRGVRAAGSVFAGPVPVRGGDCADRDRGSGQGRRPWLRGDAAAPYTRHRGAWGPPGVARVLFRGDCDDRNRGDLQRGPCVQASVGWQR
jgi:hypothetical protein